MYSQKTKKKKEKGQRKKPHNNAQIWRAREGNKKKMENPREMMMEVEAQVSGHNGEITANPPTEEEEEARKREQLKEVRKRDKERLRDLRKQQKDALQEARSQQNQVVEAQEVSFYLLDCPEGGG